MNAKSQPLSTHWADIAADKIIRERGDKDEYVCASGITPSGTVHIGNFREIISVELVVRALKDRGHKVRFIYSWDDYDVFRKVPTNMPEQEKLATYLRKPITLVPDVLGDEASYAAHNEKEVERTLPIVGIHPEYIYQAENYRSSRYAEGMKTALVRKDDIRRQLDAHRTTALSEDWWPLSVFCASCDRDETTITGWDGDYGVSYTCASCGNEETVDLRTTAAVKLPWRIDWPMRWSVEGVDFEPAGKDHHSEGGSFDTAKLTSQEIYGHEPPVTFQYDFVRIKGGSGKISSSTGEVVSLGDVLRYYQPEVVRYLFAGTRPNSEFAISFDLDVLKNYEDYDKIERNYFNKPENPKKLKKWEKDARVYELSQVEGVPASLPYQIQIRHLTTLLQIHSGNVDAVIEYLGDIPEADLERFRTRAACAWHWVQDFAPEDFRFALLNPEEEPFALSDSLAAAVKDLGSLAKEKLGDIPEKEFSNLMYDVIHAHGLESSDFFTAVYQALIGKEKGPRLLNFLHVLGKNTVVSLLSRY
ncbi:MAG: lysine--tRNA ligase [Spirochaetales bacterium]|nr:lysine--tRNA ligase [Spirochaetales bacterium]